MISGNGLTIGYASFNKPTSITRGTNTLGFHHDPELQRYKQVGVSANTLYLSAGGVLAEKVIGSGGSIQWNNYLVSSGGMIGVHIERSDETVSTLYFHKDRLGSVRSATIEPTYFPLRHIPSHARTNNSVGEDACCVRYILPPKYGS